MNATEVLTDVSPQGNVQAVVEQDDRVAYLYLMGNEGGDFGMRSCWVRNLAPAPDALDEAGMEAGVPPLLPREWCRHPDGAAPLESGRLRVVWLEEGDGAALLEDGEIVAVVPGWSGQGGFQGYARDCAGSSPLAWELGPDNAMHERVRRAAEFRAACEEEPGPWPALAEAQVAALEAALGPHSNEYRVGGPGPTPTGLLRCPVPGGAAFVTLGMCQRPMPGVERAFEDPAPHRRIELGIGLSSAVDAETERRVASWVGGQSGFPWMHHTWLGPGHTIPCSAFGEGSAVAAVLLREAPPGAPHVALPDFRGDPVRLLWGVPITAEERALAQREGSGALAARLDAAGRGWMYAPAPPPPTRRSWTSFFRR